MPRARDDHQPTPDRHRRDRQPQPEERRGRQARRPHDRRTQGAFGEDRSAGTGGRDRRDRRTRNVGVRRDDPVRPTVTGAWGGRYIAPQAAYNNSYLISYSLPAKAPGPLGDLDVNTASNTAAGDPDPSCTGSVDAPTAPPGKVCLYIGNAVNAQVTGFSLIQPGSNTTQPGDDYGFVVRILDTGTTGNTATTAAEGTWAYTAP